VGHPDPALGPHDPAFRRLLELANHPRVFVKISGCHHFSRVAFPFDDCGPLIAAVYDVFGPARLVWGSDFPHVEAACGYGPGVQLPARALPRWTDADREQVMGGNALRLYWPQR
jgi:L-fuconolactonase